MNNIPPLAAPADIARNNNTPDSIMRTDAQLSSMRLFKNRDINVLDLQTCQVT